MVSGLVKGRQLLTWCGETIALSVPLFDGRGMNCKVVCLFASVDFQEAQWRAE